MVGKRRLLRSAVLFSPLLLIGIGAPWVLADSEPATETEVVQRSRRAVQEAPDVAGDHGFRFVRIRYKDNRSGGWGRGGQTWAYDWPAAEENLYEAISRTTELHLDGDPVVLTLADSSIFDYPILYLCEPGFWQTDETEVAMLRTYFERGGFMIFDDFHDYEGYEARQWNNFYYNIKQVFPDREPVLLEPDHPIWSIYYDIDPVEAPSTKDYEGIGPYDDRYYGIFDDNGRMMAVICYNQDIGDGWEWPNRNLENASTISFQMAINFITWALTH